MKIIEHSGSLRTTYPFTVRITSLVSVVLLIILLLLFPRFRGKMTLEEQAQIIIEQMELAGEGALLKLLEARRKKLLAEGLFDEVNKRPLPYIPKVIGVVTSPTGAVIRDILHRLRDRFPRHVIIWPANVQGEGAAEQIANAIEGFNSIEADGRVPRPDLLIVARGGGSLEDLWAFNEELVVRAVAASEIQDVCYVGCKSFAGHHH